MNEEELIVNWWDLPDSLQLKLKNPLPELSKDRTLVTVRKCKRYADYGEITNLVMGIKHHIRSSKHLKLKFPLVFNSELYAKLYALMLSEGSFNTEFSLNLPEDFFHKMFFECIKGLLSVDVANKIMYDYNSGFKRSRAPAQVRYMIPLPVSVPALIKNNKSLAKSYLRVAFEAEGSPILDIASHKRYIKLTRYTSVDDCVKVDLLPLAKRVFKGKLKQFNPEVCVAIESKPPVLLLDEQKMLQKHFNIESKLYFEAVRNNHTGFRAGKITARWVLIIYAFLRWTGLIKRVFMQEHLLGEYLSLPIKFILNIF